MPSQDLLTQIHFTVAAFLDVVEKMIPRWVEQRSPQGFRDTELDIAQTCRQLADAITARILLHILADPTFQAHTSLAARSASRLRAGERKNRTIILLGGLALQLRGLEYLKPDHRGKPGRKRGSGRRGKGGSGVVPVLAALGICNGVTPALAEEVCHQVADSDSLRSARSALKRRGLELGHNKIRTLFNRVSGRAVDQRLRWLEHHRHQGLVGDGHSPVAAKRVLVAVDGGRVRMRVGARGGRRRANGHRGYKTPWKEPKLLVICLLNARGEVEQSFRPIYDGTFQDADGIFEMLAGYLGALGVSEAKQVIFVGDGAKWIWNRTGPLAQRLGLRDAHVVEVVDWYHAVEVLGEVAKLAKKWSAAKREKWICQAKATLFQGNTGAVYRKIKDLAVGSRSKKVKSHLDYFKRNRSRMQYKAFKEAGVPRGSGVVESVIRRVVNMRMKGNGTFWKERNAEGMLLLRSYLKSGRYDDLLAWSRERSAPWWPLMSSKGPRPSPIAELC